MTPPINRRDAVLDLAKSAALFTIVPRHVLGRGYRAPSDTLNMACVGIGGMGENDVRNVAFENVYALCDIDSKFADKVFVRYPQAKRYKDYREMLDKEGSSIDAVVIATPDHSHAAIAMAALKAGKHVYCQKPLTRTIGEAKALAAEAARRPKQSTVMGNQGHALEGIRLIREWVEGGMIGTVQRVEFWTDRPIWPQAINRPSEAHNIPPWFDWNLWLGPAPERPWHPAYAHFNWRGWWDFGTGALGDMACHIMDAAYWTLQLKYPARISAETTPLFAETAPKSCRIEFDFPARGNLPPVKLVWRDGGLTPPRPAGWPDAKPWPFDGSGQMWIGDQGVLIAGTYGENPMLVDATKQAALVAKPLPQKYPRTQGVHKEWVEAIRTGKQPGSNFVDYAGPFTEMILLGNLAVRSGRVIEVDPVTGVLKTTTGIPPEWITPVYRSGWTL